MSKVWLARVTNGKPQWSEWNMADIREWCKENEGKIVRLTYETPKRSNAQNRYLWLYLGIIETETGNIATDVHEWAKRRFLKPRFITVNGQDMMIPGSTTDLDKVSFGEFLDKLSAETGVPIPDREATGFYVESNVKKLKIN